ncbi:hypothetical protein M513_13156 [Trichuris suis]|uniref:Nose resistant-to-fluoxetine protein N-terminal domain-containing protein n=1 Tax=Trichuris suis TaxID=68888 RepID=A0A085LLX8_9BILA|nr:hypothetical protein M513_13156 [Trichuris suis]
MARYFLLFVVLLFAERPPTCAGGEQFTWTSLSYRLTQLRASLLQSLYSKTTEYSRRWLASPHEANPINELIRLIRLLVQQLNSACQRLEDLRDDKIDDQCRQDMALSVCAVGNLLNGTVSKVLHVCNVLIDDLERQRCQNETDKWIYDNIWAIRFIDAFGKIPSGVLDGNLIFLGILQSALSWTQELGVDVIGGRNCVVQLGLPRCLRKWGICVPATCMASDIERLSDIAMPNLMSAGMRVRCEEDSPLANDPCAVAAITFGGILLLMVVVASVFDFWRQLQSSQTAAKALNSRSSSPNTFSMGVVNDDEERHKGNAVVAVRERGGWKYSVLLSFSAYTNIRRLSCIDASHLSYLNGIRCLSIMYAIFGYTCMFALNNLDNALVGMDMIGEFKSQLVNSAALSADTFFLLSCCLCSYWFFKHLCHGSTCRPIRWVCFLGRRMENCVKSWWINLLFLQNFLYVQQPCFGWSWFVAAEVQCFLVALAFLWLLSRYPRWGLALATLATAGLAICHLIIVVYNDYPPSYLGTTNLKELKLEDYMTNVFVKPYTHGCSYVIGICLGYLLVKLKNKEFRMNTLPKSFIFSSIVVVNAATVFGVYDYANGRTWSLVEKGMYASLSRLTWPLTLAACGQPDVIIGLLESAGTIDLRCSACSSFGHCWSAVDPSRHLPFDHPECGKLVLYKGDCGRMLSKQIIHLLTYNGISATIISYLVAFVLYLCAEGRPILNIRDRYLSMEEMPQRTSLRM